MLFGIFPLLQNACCNLMPACRECWAQRPGDRPSFDEVVGRLRRMLDGAPAS